MPYVLIADDEADFAEAVATVLGEENHETLVTHDAHAVRDLLQQRLPDALILDVMLPENSCNGFELARDIDRVYAGLPVLLLTAVNEQFPLGFSEKDIDSRWLPVSAFLEKPIDFRVLREKLGELLSPERCGPR